MLICVPATSTWMEQERVVSTAVWVVSIGEVWQEVEANTDSFFQQEAIDTSLREVFEENMISQKVDLMKSQEGGLSHVERKQL